MGHIHSVSVVICTRNRAGSLRAGLAELRKMDIAPDVFLEVIVVDNGSTDDSEEVVEDFGRSSPFPVRYVYQRKKGLGYARNAGIEFSVGEIVAFTDDDCFVDPEWLHGIVNEFAADPDLHGIGGVWNCTTPRQADHHHDLPGAARVFTRRADLLLYPWLQHGLPPCGFSKDRHV